MLCLLTGIPALCLLPGTSMLCLLPGISVLYLLPGISMLCLLPGIPVLCLLPDISAEVRHYAQSLEMTATTVSMNDWVAGRGFSPGLVATPSRRYMGGSSGMLTVSAS